MLYLSLACFLSATILPFASEGFLFVALMKGFNPYWCLLFASIGNCLGSTFTYYMGVLCDNYVIKRFFSLNRNSPEIKKALDRINKYKSPILLLSWFPVVGDPIVLASGIIGIRLRDFMIYTYSGRICRYAILVAAFVFVR
jgi:membrane protein YqaA with SNARE-associated domain